MNICLDTIKWCQTPKIYQFESILNYFVRWIRFLGVKMNVLLSTVNKLLWIRNTRHEHHKRTGESGDLWGLLKSLFLAIKRSQNQFMVLEWKKTKWNGSNYMAAGFHRLTLLEYKALILISQDKTCSKQKRPISVKKKK